MPATSASRLIMAPQREIWGLLSDIGNARRWNAAWSSVEYVSKQTHGPDTEFLARTDEGKAFQFVISAWVAPEYIEFTPVRDETERYGITLESQAFRLQPEGEEATRVELIARASTHGIRGWVLGLLFWRGYQKQGLNAALERLEAAFPSKELDGPREEATPATD
ncbi:MAG: SRPBCC family protein [Chloroflexi bacterium]|nr:MAG: SRPBCC family protein [Chloroflexota bacterium]